MSIISSLFSMQSFLVVSFFGLGAFALNYFMGSRNSIVGAFTGPVMQNIKLAVYAIAAIAICAVLWKINSVYEENKELTVDNAIQLVSIDSMKHAEGVSKSVNTINQQKAIDVVVAEKKIETKYNKILENSTRREKVIESTFSGIEKQEALSTERIATLWEVYDSGIEPPPNPDHPNEKPTETPDLKQPIETEKVNV